MRDLESVFCKSTILVKMGWTLLAVDTHRVDAKSVKVANFEVLGVLS